jgi:hypothetical protein
MGPTGGGAHSTICSWKPAMTPERRWGSYRTRRHQNLTGSADIVRFVRDADGSEPGP